MHVESLLHGDEDLTGIHTLGIPEQAREMFLDEYEEYDRYMEKVRACDKQIITAVKDMEWETGSGKLKGNEMLHLLTTVPGIGEYTASIWLCRRRFAVSVRIPVFHIWHCQQMKRSAMNLVDFVIDEPSAVCYNQNRNKPQRQFVRGVIT